MVVTTLMRRLQPNITTTAADVAGRRRFIAASTPYIVLGYKTPDMNKWWAEEQTISPFNC